MAIDKLVIFIILAVSIVALADGDAALFSSQNYLNLPTEEKFDEPFHKTIRDALLSLDISKRSIAVVLNLARKDPDIDQTHRQVYKTVLSVTRKGDSCPKQLVEVYISIMAQAWAKDHRLLTFEKFMNLADPQKFKVCAKTVNEEFKANPIEPPAANDFFHILNRTFRLQPHSSREDLHEKLMRFSLTHHAFDAGRMVESAREIEVPEFNSITDDYDFLRNFWLTRCHQFDEDPLSRMLNMLSVARSLSFRYTDYDTRFLLLNEYRRLCFEWLDDSTPKGRYPDIEMNIRRLLNQSTLRMVLSMADRFIRKRN